MPPQPDCRGVGHILGLVQHQREAVHHIIQGGVAHIQVGGAGVGGVPQLVEEVFELVSSSYVAVVARHVSFGTQTRRKCRYRQSMQL